MQRGPQWTRKLKQRATERLIGREFRALVLCGSNDASFSYGLAAALSAWAMISRSGSISLASSFAWLTPSGLSVARAFCRIRNGSGRAILRYSGGRPVLTSTLAASALHSTRCLLRVSSAADCSPIGPRLVLSPACRDQSSIRRPDLAGFTRSSTTAFASWRTGGAVAFA